MNTVLLEPKSNTGCPYDEPPDQYTQPSAVNADADFKGLDGNAAYELLPFKEPDKPPGNGPDPPSVTE